MDHKSDLMAVENKIATFKNSVSPGQNVDIVYLREENAFLTVGISKFFAEKEIFIPAYLVVSDFQLIGAIVSSILEKLSQMCDSDGQFSYASRLEVMGQQFSLTEKEKYMVLDRI